MVKIHHYNTLAAKSDTGSVSKQVEVHASLSDLKKIYRALVIVPDKRLPYHVCLWDMTQYRII